MTDPRPPQTRASISLDIPTSGDYPLGYADTNVEVTVVAPTDSLSAAELVNAVTVGMTQALRATIPGTPGACACQENSDGTVTPVDNCWRHSLRLPGTPSEPLPCYVVDGRTIHRGGCGACPPDPDSVAAQRLQLARQALVDTGYFTVEQVGMDVAPRITELHSALTRDETRPAACTCPPGGGSPECAYVVEAVEGSDDTYVVEAVEGSDDTEGWRPLHFQCLDRALEAITWDRTSTDAMVWAQALEAHVAAGLDAADAGWLVGWFANYAAAVEAHAVKDTQ